MKMSFIWSYNLGNSNLYGASPMSYATWSTLLMFFELLVLELRQYFVVFESSVSNWDSILQYRQYNCWPGLDQRGSLDVGFYLLCCLMFSIHSCDTVSVILLWWCLYECKWKGTFTNLIMHFLELGLRSLTDLVYLQLSVVWYFIYKVSISSSMTSLDPWFPYHTAE